MIDIKSIIDTLKNHFSQRTYILPLQVTVLFIFETNKPKTTRFSILSIPGASAIYITKKEKIEPFTIKEKNGTLLFKSIPLQEIVRQLSNAFHTDIRIEDVDLQNYHMTATFSDGETLEEILSLLCRNQKFGYTKTNDTITITQKLN